MFLIKQICVDLDAKSWHENARGGKCLRWFLYIWLNIINHWYQRSILSLRLSKGCFETNWYDDDDHDDDGGGDDGGGGGADGGGGGGDDGGGAEGGGDDAAAAGDCSSCGDCLGIDTKQLSRYNHAAWII